MLQWRDMRDLRDALELWTTVAPYSLFPSQTIAWRLMPALESGQYRIYRDEDGKAYGLITWAFMTEEEFETRDYSGEEIFARDDGDVLVFVDMIAPRGRNDVLSICRDMRRSFVTMYPHVDKVLAHRGQRTGTFPNKGG